MMTSIFYRRIRFLFFQKYSKNIIGVVLLCILPFFVSSQNINHKISAAIQDVIKKKSHEFKLVNETFSYCDFDSDGFMPINLLEIKEYILGQNADQFGTQGGIFISTSSGNVFFINDLSGVPQKTLVCSNNFGSGMLDIAINKDGAMYVAVANKIYKINETNCQIETPYDFGFGGWVTSLSFDRDNNLYLGGFDSKVYRLENGAYDQLVMWHNFVAGEAAGDFVMYNDKMYIAWNLNGATRLYEVTVDSNTNYISHVDLGSLQNDTFGLASELGVLYGVTSSELYKINLSPLSFDLVLANNSFDAWYGAAGKNEAVEIQSDVFETLEEAQNNQNALPVMWTNTISGEQTVYVALTNVNNNQQIIIAVDLVIGVSPIFTDPSPVVNCVDRTVGTAFDLRALAPEIIGLQSDIKLQFFDTYQDAFNNTPALADAIMINSSEKEIFVRMENLKTSCYGIYNFTIKILEALVFEDLNNLFYCRASNFPIHIPINLDEKIPELLGSQHAPSITVTFFQTAQDANSGTSVIAGNFYLDEIEKPIFARIQDDNTGCFVVKKFMIYTVVEIPTDHFTYSVTTTDWTFNNNSIQIAVTGSGAFEYSIDGINYQEDTFFGNLSVGDYEVHVRDKTDCSAVIKEVLLLMHPNFFTPNGDGFNDYWTIKFSNKEPEMEIYIFDRYGKLLRSLSPFETGWDGNYNGNPLPSTDYWFLVKREGGREYRGHFSLKR